MGCFCQNNVEEVSKVPELDDSFDGPVKERSCRDVFWLILFIAFVGGILACMIFSVSEGDIDRIVNGMDSNGNVCGKKNKKIEVFKKEGDDYVPEIFEKSGEDYTNKKYVRRPIANKITYFNRNVQVVCDEKCADNETSFFWRCVPFEFTTGHMGSTNILAATGNERSFFREAAGDIQFCWKEILYLCLIALGLTLIIIFMYRFFAKIIIYVSMVLMIIVSTAALVYIWYQYTRAKKRADEGASWGNAKLLRSATRSWLGGAVVSTIFWLFFLLMMWAMRKRIKLVVALFTEAGKALTAMPFLMLQPFWTFLCLAVVGSLWLYTIMWIQSNGYFELEGGKVYLRHGLGPRVMKWYCVFGLLWLSWFCFGCQHMVIAGAVAKWFFTRDKSNLGSPILRTISNLIRYHLGSIALGSFIISVIKFIRLLLKFLERNMANSRNPNVACLFMIIQCCIKCFESCLKYITRNAYIEIAIYGVSFCTAAKKAYQLLISNSLRVTAINSVGDFALFMGKAIVVLVTAFIGMEMIKNKMAVTHVWVPVILASFFAYLIADCFISIYEMTIDTLFLCFCEDCERNDGVTRPYFMSSGLMAFVEESSQTLNVIGGKAPAQPAA